MAESSPDTSGMQLIGCVSIAEHRSRWTLFKNSDDLFGRARVTKPSAPSGFRSSSRATDGGSAVRGSTTALAMAPLVWRPDGSWPCVRHETVLLT